MQVACEYSERLEDLIQFPKCKSQQSQSNLNIAVQYTSAIVRSFTQFPVYIRTHDATREKCTTLRIHYQRHNLATQGTHNNTSNNITSTLHDSLRATAWLNEREHLLAQANTFHKQMKLPCLHSRILPQQQDEKSELAPPGMLNSMHIIG